ncbi:MAG: cryptochrome/photolyase family protein [Deltaproteobacteria bacterium]|nr:cryptochrome/photolyase family protein [Deltaproteobacteria bacterium]
MEQFRAALAERLAGQPAGPRRWLYVPYDQLTDAAGPLARAAPETLGVLLVESVAKARTRPYHKQKLALVLANMRHFALEQAARGVAVRYLATRGSYRAALERAAAELGPLTMMAAAERSLAVELQPLVASGALEVVPHEGWLSTPEDFTRSQRGRRPWRMDAFYRHMRKATGILMDEGAPRGGKLSFDEENRRPWPGTPPAAVPPRFEPDVITREVGALVEARFGDHPGQLDLGALPTTAADAQAVLRWAMQACLPDFGPFEDAMSEASTTLFHTRLSPLINLHRVLPRQALAAALASRAPLSSVEGFVRQILGWREFVRHVHVATDGFRDAAHAALRRTPTDAGYGAWRGAPWADPDAPPPEAVEGTALGATRPLPAAFWGAPSGLRCLDNVVQDVLREGYSHHITRLMVLGNLATLLDVSPRALTDWFWCMYTDAYDWVVEPNVLGMATYGLGPLFTTKPYVCGQAYLKKMSDACRRCDLADACPVTPLYWAFLERHRAALAENPRLALPLASAARRAPEARAADARVFEAVSATLGAGGQLSPGYCG